MRFFRLLPVLLGVACLNAAPPVITSIQNPASNILPGLPNFGIAQGQLFVLYGTDMGPTTLLQAPTLPLGTTLGGVTIKVTPPGGTAVNVPILYVLNTQIVAVMPSNFPVTVNGVFATMQVTYNGTVGNTFSVRVVDSNFGISTVNQSGGGAAVVTDANYKVITSTNSAIPNNTYTIWGTGLGATDSDNNYATKGTFPKVHVFVGGIEAAVTYAGISGGIGLNQINFTIPAGLSGCYVSLVVQSDTTPARVSNGTTIPIAAGGGACTDVNSFPSTAAGIVAAKGSISVGAINLDGDKKQALGFFLKFTPAQFSGVNVFGTVSLGNCVTTMQIGNSNGGGNDGPPPSTGLDAGTAMTLTPPSGAAVSMPLALPGVFQGNLTGLTTGTYTASNGSGGKDVGAFSLSFNGPPAFAWTNSTVSTVSRSSGLKINWAGGDSNSFVDIVGFAGGNPIFVNGQPIPSNVSMTFECQVPAAPGTFTIPPSVLLAMPPASGSSPNGSISVSLQTLPAALTIPGVDLGFVFENTAQINQPVVFQ